MFRRGRRNMKSLGRTQTIVAGATGGCFGLAVFWTFVPPPEGLTTFVSVVVPAIVGVLVGGGALIKARGHGGEE